MKQMGQILSGREVAGYIKERHAREVAGYGRALKLAVLAVDGDAATASYMRAKARYGQDIGVAVDLVNTSDSGLLTDIQQLNTDPTVTGLIVQLPLPDAALTEQALAAIDPAKDVDGLGPNSPLDPATPKGILWLLAAYDVDLSGRIAVVGQGRLVGRPLADMLEASGRQVSRLDINTPDLAAEIGRAEVVVAATGRAGLIKAGMVKPGAVVIDTGSPDSELASDLRTLTDIQLTPNPGGVGPMTVAALFDNLLIAASAK